ncbi:MAG: AIR synthase-related protein [Candidatus Marinimicrobia bacterium]|nr:AIR synthase-related protein [Candidatus Neomarinimicrobiota bacterium]
MPEPKVTSNVIEKLGFSEENFSHLEELIGRPPTHAELTLLSAYRDKIFLSKWVRQIRNSMDRRDVVSYQPSNVVSVEVDGSIINLTARIGGCGVKVRGAADQQAYHAVMGLFGEIVDEGALSKIVSCGQVVGSHETIGIRAMSDKLGSAMKECYISTGINVVVSDFFSDANLGSKGLFSAAVLGVTASAPDSPMTVKKEGDPVFFLSKRRGRSSKAGLTIMQTFSQLSHQLMQRPYLRALRSVSEDGVGVAAARMSVEHGMGITLDATSIPVVTKSSVVGTILLHGGRRGLLTVISQGFNRELNMLTKEFKVDCHRVGESASSQMLTVKKSKKTVVSLPVETIAKAHELSAEQPGSTAVTVKPETVNAAGLKKPRSYRGALLSLLASPNVAQTVHRSDPAAASADSVTPVMELSSSGRALWLDPRVGGRTAVAAAARKLVCSGINPAAVVLNAFVPADILRGQDEMLREIFRGADEIARVFDIHVIDTKITATDQVSTQSVVAGVFGAISRNYQLLTPMFKRTGDFVLILGSHRGELGGSEYLRLNTKKVVGPPPAVDLKVEPKLRDIVLMAHSVDLIESAIDISSGGLTTALAHCLLNSPKGTGVRIHMSSKITDQELLFGETQGVMIVTVHEDAIIEIERICMRMGVPCTAIGRVTDNGRLSFNELIYVKVSDLQQKHREGLNIFRRALH